MCQSSLKDIQQALDYSITSSASVREIYSDLGYTTDLQNAKTKVKNYLREINTLPESRIKLIKPEILRLIKTLPSSITMSNLLELTPEITEYNIEKIFPTETTEYKEELKNFNNIIFIDGESKLFDINYISKQKDNVLLIKKEISTPETLNQHIIIEYIPASEDQIEFLSATPQISKGRGYITAKFSFNSLAQGDKQSILYKVDSSNFNLIKDTITLVIPENLNVAGCGNNVCNEDENNVICPEDCKNTPIEESSTKLITIIIIVIILIAGIAFLIVKKPSFLDKLIKKINISKLIPEKGSPFKHKTNLKSTISYIKKANKRGMPANIVENNLLKKGWSKEQISFAKSKAK